MKKVLLLLARGFEHMESSAFIDVLGWAKHCYDCDVDLITCGFQRQVESSFFEIPVIANKLIGEVDADEYAALAIPGGFSRFGYYEEAYDEKFLDLIREFDSKEKVIASICVGSLPLGRSGILEGRNATTYHLSGGKRQKELASFGVNVINEPVVTDKNIITSYCPETAVKVAFELLAMLTSKSKCDQVMQGMGY